MSSVGVDFAKNRSNIYLALGIVFLAVGIALMWSTFSYAEVKFCYFSWLIPYLILIIGSQRYLACVRRHVFSCSITLGSNLLLSTNESERDWRSNLKIVFHHPCNYHKNTSVSNKQDNNNYSHTSFHFFAWTIKISPIIFSLYPRKKKQKKRRFCKAEENFWVGRFSKLKNKSKTLFLGMK